jgi:NAD(P)-dependent dehydrogenase (short-subunit alcohol dehydrogenase family)
LSIEKMARELEGKVAAVTGAASGIGRASAEAMLAAGARVVLVDREAPPDLDGARAERLDVTDEAATEALFDRLSAEGWTPDVVVPNAGILHLAPATEIDGARFRASLEVNLTGAFLTARAGAARMREGGRIVFTTSLFGLRGGAGNAAYAASKFGMVGLMQSMAADLAPRGIAVNAVAPGQIATEMLEALVAQRLAQGMPDPRERLLARLPTGRLGTPEEVAGTYVYLASDLSAYVTGQTILVDGGWQVG